MNSTLPLVFCGLPFLGAAAFGVILLRWAISRFRANRALRTRGLVAEAEIIGWNMWVSARGGHAYNLKYQYTVPDGTARQFTRTQAVGWILYNSSQEQGKRISIKYLPDDPEKTARIEETIHIIDPRDIALAGSGLWFMVVGIFAFLLILGAAVSPPAVKPTATNSLTLALTQTGVVTAVASDADLTAIRTAITPHLSEWKNQPDKKLHHVDPASIELPASASVQEVEYGYCIGGKTFFIFALQNVQPGTKTETGSGFGYLDPVGPCAIVRGSQIDKQADYGDGWLKMRIELPLVAGTTTPPPQ